MTRGELKDIIKECLEETQVEMFDESVEEEMFEESTIIALDESARRVFISSQGKEIKDKINDIIYENTNRLGGFDKIKRFLFGGSNAIKVSEAEKVVAGVSKLFDACHASKIYSLRTASNDTVNYKYFTAVKGKYVYEFTINFNPASSKMVSLSFKERIMDKKNFVSLNAAEIIKFAVANCSPDYLLQIKKKEIISVSIGNGKYDSNNVNEDLYNKLEKKFPNECVYDEVKNSLKFSVRNRI